MQPAVAVTGRIRCSWPESNLPHRDSASKLAHSIRFARFEVRVVHALLLGIAIIPRFIDHGMIGNLLQPELVELIRQRNFGQLREILAEFSAPDIAEIFTDLSPDDEAVLMRILPHDVAADVFEYLSVDDQEKMLHALGNEQVAQILNELPPDERTALLEELPAAATQKLLNLLSPAERKIAADLLGYPKDSIGRRMTPEYVAIQQSWTVAGVLEHLRKVGRDRESLNQLYVVDERGRLVNWVRLRNVVVADLNTPVVELLEPQIITLRAADDQETAVAAFKKYDVTLLPVVATCSGP